MLASRGRQCASVSGSVSWQPKYYSFDFKAWSKLQKDKLCILQEHKQLMFLTNVLNGDVIDTAQSYKYRADNHDTRSQKRALELFIPIVNQDWLVSNTMRLNQMVCRLEWDCHIFRHFKALLLI